MALVSIITPLFNRAHLLNETWVSIKNQTYSDWEWIVVDDGSIDNSVELIQAIAQLEERVKLFLRPPELTKGPSACRNHGAKMASGKYFIFLDSDDLLSFDCLSQRVSVMSANGTLDFAVFPMLCFHQVPGDSDKVFNHFLKTKEEYLKFFLIDNPPWQTMCPIWKGSSFLQLGGFNELYKCMEDPDMHVRALLSDYSFEVVNKNPDCFYRNSFVENQSQHRFWRKSIEGRIIFLMDVYEYLKNNIESKDQRQLYISYLSQFYLSLIKGFMLARLQSFQKEFIEVSKWAKERGIISDIQYIKMKLIHRIYSSKSKIIDLLHLRGIVYHLI